MTSWLSLGGSVESGATAASWGEYEVQVFVIKDDSQIWNRYWDGSEWHQWESLGGSFTGQPAASARDADRIDIFAIDTAGVLRRRYWNGKEWVPWEDVKGAPRNAKSVACSWSGTRLDLFAWGANNELWYAAVET